MTPTKWAEPVAAVAESVYVSTTEREGLSVVDTVVCDTCGGDGKNSCERCGDDHKIVCPDCVNGRQPTPEVLEVMAGAIYEAQFPGFSWEKVKEVNAEGQYLKLALAAWLAEHREET
jgi:hypothetical protein